MTKKLLIILGVVVAVPLLLYGSLVIHNNVGASDVSAKAIDSSLERSIQWLQSNREKILEDNNSMLWWMLKRSFDLTRDRRLGQLYRAYRTRYLMSYYNNSWRLLFEPDALVTVGTDQVRGLPDYNQYFLYGLSCSPQLAQTETIRRQMSVDFCSRYHPISPACVTHQMMGLDFQLRRHCGKPDRLKARMHRLQQMILRQLTWDPRVVDVYIQRVLMLVDTGAADRVKPRWLRRVLDAQLPDGAWGGFNPLVPLGGHKAFGFVAKGFAVRRSKGSFHTTAQGLLLMSLLSNHAMPESGS